MKSAMPLTALALSFGAASSAALLRRAQLNFEPGWRDPADLRCGAIEPWSNHKPYEPVLNSMSLVSKDTQCHACRVRACNAGLLGPGGVGGCRCIAFRDASGNYATDCKKPKDLPAKYESCGEPRDCHGLKGQCVSAAFQMEAAKEAPWMKDDWKGSKARGMVSALAARPKNDWTVSGDPRCGTIEPWSKHKPYEPIVGSTEKAKESQCLACKIRACNSGLPAPEQDGGCRCVSFKDASGNYGTDCKNPVNGLDLVKYETCGEVRDCKALEGQCVSAKFKMDSAKEAPWMKKGWKGAKLPESFGVRSCFSSGLPLLGLMLVLDGV